MSAVATNPTASEGPSPLAAQRRAIVRGVGAGADDPILLLEETGCGLRGRFEYNTDLFEAFTIVRFLRHLGILPTTS